MFSSHLKSYFSIVHSPLEGQSSLLSIRTILNSRMLWDNWQTSVCFMSTRLFSTTFQVCHLTNVSFLLNCHNTPVQVKPSQMVFCVTHGAHISVVAGLWVQICSRYLLYLIILTPGRMHSTAFWVSLTLFTMMLIPSQLGRKKLGLQSMKDTLRWWNPGCPQTCKVVTPIECIVLLDSQCQTKWN